MALTQRQIHGPQENKPSSMQAEPTKLQDHHTGTATSKGTLDTSCTTSSLMLLLSREDLNGLDWGKTRLKPT